MNIVLSAFDVDAGRRVTPGKTARLVCCTSLAMVAVRAYLEAVWLAITGKAGSIAQFALVAMCLSGCVSITTFPDKWEPMVKAAGETCPKISGRYSDKEAVENTDKGGQVNLGARYALSSLILDAHDRVYITSVERIITSVELQLETEKILLVRLLKGDTVVKTAQLLRENGDFSCSKGVLTLKARYSLGAAIFIGVFAVSHVRLASTTGYLLLNEFDLGVIGLPIPVIPVMGYHWVRFAELLPFPPASPREREG